MRLDRWIEGMMNCTFTKIMILLCQEGSAGGPGYWFVYHKQYKIRICLCQEGCARALAYWFRHFVIQRRFRGSFWILICKPKTIYYLHSVMPKGFRGSTWILNCVPKTIQNVTSVVQRRFHGSLWILICVPKTICNHNFVSYWILICTPTWGSKVVQWNICPRLQFHTDVMCRYVRGSFFDGSCFPLNIVKIIHGSFWLLIF